MKEIVLSYDYELFFGDISGTVQNTLIKPTNLLLEQLDSLGFKANFFVDYLMLKYLRKNSDGQSKNDLHQLENQIKDIVKRGHRVELHIHPHWINAQYIGNGLWDFSDFSHYSLSTFSKEEIIQMFDEGLEILHKITRVVDPGYQIVAFRAGGWAVQPFSQLKEAFVKNNIKVDSSVAYGVCSDNSYSSFDFRNIPSRAPYLFTDDVLNDDPQGLFLEVPISTYKRTILHRLIDVIHRMMAPSTFKVITDGTHKRESDSHTGINKKDSISMFSLSRHSWLSIIPTVLLSGNKQIVFIDHPKDFTYSGLVIMRKLSHFCKTKLYCRF